MAPSALANLVSPQGWDVVPEEGRLAVLGPSTG